MNAEGTSKLLKREFLTLLPGFFMTVLASSVCSLMNGLIVGNCIGTAELAAIGIAAPFTQVLAICYSTLSSGSQAVCCRCIGQGDKKGADAAFSSALLAGGLLGLILTLLCTVFAVSAARLLGADEGLSFLTAEYIRGLAVGFVPCLLNPILMTFIQMGSHPKKADTAVLIQTAVNLGLDYWLIAVLHKDLFYASLASSIGAFAAFLYLVSACVRFGSVARFSLRYVGLKLVGPVLKYGSMQTVTYSMCALRGIVFSHLLVSSGGTDAASAWAVMLNATVPLSALDLGIEQVCEVLFGISVGENDGHSVRQVWHIMLKWGGLCMALLCGLFLILAQQLASLFQLTGASLSYAAYCIRVFCAFSAIDMMTYALIGLWQKMGLLRWANAVSFLSYGAVPVLSGLLFTRLWGSYGAPLALAFGTLAGLAVISLIGHFSSAYPFPDHVLLLDYGIHEAPHINLTARNAEDVVYAAEALTGLCEEHELDKRRAYYISLCLEEMAINVVRHGFPGMKDPASGEIEIFAYIRDNTVTLRLRDNAVIFDPRARLTEIEKRSQDPMLCIGIRTVMKIQKEMTYQTLIGKNVLMIRI